MEEGTNIKDLLAIIKQQNDQLLLEKQAKPFKLPFKARVGNGKVKRGWAHVIIIRNNGEVDFMKSRVDDDGCIEIDGFPRIGTAEHRLTYKNKPLYIIPEWSMKPYSLTERMDAAVQEKMDVFGRRAVLARLVSKEMKPGRKGFGMIGWIILGAIILIGGYYLMSGGKLF